MQASNAPSKSAVPFAESGTKNTIPVASQIGVTPGAASFTDGFPPLTMTPLAAGGVPPYGADFNGILNFLSAAVRWAQAGGHYPYDSTFSTAIGGYPKGATVLGTSGNIWLNTADNNVTNPDAGGSAGWVPVLAGKAATKTVMTSSGTWTRPAGCVRIRIRLQGGGAGGASGTSVDGAVGRGGGGGAYLEATISSPPASASVVIGAAGAGSVPGSGLQATDGGATTFAGTYTAGGGVAPLTASTISAGASSPGGIASGGDINVHGYASFACMGSTSVGFTGRGGDSVFGSGGQSFVTAQNGDNAIGYGAGGGGSFRGGGVNYNGGNGAPGIAIIEEFYV